MTRRDLLRAAGVLPVVFGLGGCARRPSWFGEALRKIGSEGRPGLVFRLPADPKRRCTLGHALAWLVEREDVEGLEVALQSVILCLEDEGVRGLLDGAQEGDDLLLIDGDGTVVDGRPIPADVDLAVTAGELLDGPGLSRLKARAEAARQAAPPEALAAFQAFVEDVDAESVRCWAGPLLPLLVLFRRDSVGYRVEEAIRSLTAAPPPLPYGASLKRGGAMPCGEDATCRYGVCMTCGLAVVTARSRDFVKFLAK